MFKNLTTFRWVCPSAITSNLAVFEPTMPTQPRSVGWVPPREAGGDLVEAIGGHWIMAARIETRGVPGSALAKWVDEAADAIERETGRKPNRKTRAALKDDALLALLPQAFPKTTTALVWLARNRVMIDTASASVADAIITLLVQDLGVEVRPIVTEMAPAALMGGWLLDGAPDFDEFSLGRACELKSDTREAVRYVNTSIVTDEVKQHARIMVPVSLALDWKDKVSFTLTDTMVLKGISIADLGAGEFDANVAIVTGTLGPLLDDLMDALGGEAVAPA